MCHFHFFYANSLSIRTFFIFCRRQKYKKNRYTIIPACKNCDFVRILIDFKLFVRNVKSYYLANIPTKFPVKRSCACAFITIASQTIATHYIMPISATIFCANAYSILTISSINKVINTTPNPKNDTIELENEALRTPI